MPAGTSVGRHAGAVVRPVPIDCKEVKKMGLLTDRRLGVVALVVATAAAALAAFGDVAGTIAGIAYTGAS
jgi:hypothetical protein